MTDWDDEQTTQLSRRKWLFCLIIINCSSLPPTLMPHCATDYTASSHCSVMALCSLQIVESNGTVWLLICVQSAPRSTLMKADSWYSNSGLVLKSNNNFLCLPPLIGHTFFNLCTLCVHMQCGFFALAPEALWSVATATVDLTLKDSAQTVKGVSETEM